MRDIISPLDGIRSPFGARRGAAIFSPASLFAAGEQGVWYDPSDMTTLFQDASGTTPVTAVETAVGLMLDKSQGLVLGPELVTNGTFDSNVSGWTPNANCSVSWDAGRAKVTSGALGGANLIVSSGFTTVIGQRYKVQMTFAKGTVTSDTAFLAATNNSDGSGAYFSTSSTGFGNGTLTAYFVATATTTYIYGRWNNTNATETWFLDDVSVKSIPGNHAIAFNDTTARPVLSARVNLLTKTEQFDDAAWEKLGGGTGSVPTVTANQGTAPDGTNTADRVQFNKGAGSTSSDFSVLRAASGSRATVPSNTSIKASLRIKSNTGSPQKISVYINTFTSGGTGAGSSTITEYTATSDWQTIDITYTTSATAVAATVTAALGGVGSTVNTSDVLIWGADLRVANDTALPVYQRVNTSTDYDTTGFPMYLRFESDDFLVTANNAFSAFGAENFAFSVFSGLRRNTSDYGAIFALANNTSSGAGDNDFLIADAQLAPNQTSGSLRRFSGSTTTKSAFGGALSSPQTFVYSWNRTSSTGQVRINAVGGAAVDQTLPAINLVLGTIGARRRGTTPTLDGYLNGRIYSLIVRGAATSETLIGQTENWISGKMGGGYYPTGFDFLVDANGNQLTDESGNPLIAQALYS